MLVAKLTCLLLFKVFEGWVIQTAFSSECNMHVQCMYRANANCIMLNCNTTNQLTHRVESHIQGTPSPQNHQRPTPDQVFDQILLSSKM